MCEEFARGKRAEAGMIEDTSDFCNEDNRKILDKILLAYQNPKGVFNSMMFWLAEGKSIEESRELTKGVEILSKFGGTSEEEMTKIIYSIMEKGSMVIYSSTHPIKTFCENNQVATNKFGVYQNTFDNNYGITGCVLP